MNSHSDATSGKSVGKWVADCEHQSDAESSIQSTEQWTGQEIKLPTLQNIRILLYKTLVTLSAAINTPGNIFVFILVVTSTFINSEDTTSLLFMIVNAHVCSSWVCNVPGLS